MTRAYNWKFITSTVILVFAILASPALAKQKSKDVSSAAVSNVSATNMDKNGDIQVATHTVVVYYMYMEPRCESCRNIEKFTKEAIDAEFEEELEAGLLIWMPVDVKKEGNWHYVEDFQLQSKTVVVADYKGFKEDEEKLLAWKNLEEIWPLLKNKPEFLKYIQAETQIFLDQEYENKSESEE